MAQEIERRFLVRDVRILDGRRGEHIIQGYLAKEIGSISTYFSPSTPWLVM